MFLVKVAANSNSRVTTVRIETIKSGKGDLS